MRPHDVDTLRLRDVLDKQQLIGRIEAETMQKKTREMLAETKQPEIIIMLAMLDRALRTILFLEPIA